MRNNRDWILRRLPPALAAACAAALLTGCGGSSVAPSSAAPTAPTTVVSSVPAGPASFSVSPIPPSELQSITALGAMNPWGHTLPTDHLYFSHHFNSGPFPPVTIFAPATGVVESVLSRGGGDAKISVRVNSRFIYAIDHVILKPEFASGTPIQAGTALSTSTSGVFDFGVVNLDRPLTFANPARYSRETLYGDGPLKYFEEPLRSQLYAKVDRDGSERDGRIDYDVKGTLSGNWFADDLPPERSSIGGDMSVGTRQLSFARDVFAPDRRRVSLGGLGMTGLWGVPPDAPEFSSVTPASGLVAYRLLETGERGAPPGTRQLDVMLVQMLDASRLRIEVLPDSRATTAAFGPNARIYLR